MSVALAAVGAYFVISNVGYIVAMVMGALEQASSESKDHDRQPLTLPIRFAIQLLYPLITGGLGIALWRHAKRIGGALHDDGPVTAWSMASIDALHATALSILGAMYVASGATELFRGIPLIRLAPLMWEQTQLPVLCKGAGEVLIGAALAYWSRTLVQLWHRFSHRPHGGGTSPV